MPLTLGYTPYEQKMAKEAELRWSNSRGLAWPLRSTRVADLVVEQGQYISGDPRLLVRIAREVAHQVIEADETGWQQEPQLSGMALAIVHARWVLCGLYVQNLQEWRDEALSVLRQSSGSEQDCQELPKTGWQERDNIERALWQLGKCVDRLPDGWGSTPLEAMVDGIIDIPGSSSESEEEAETDSEEETESESEDEFVLHIRGDIRDLFPGGDDEGRETESESEEDNDDDSGEENDDSGEDEEDSEDEDDCSDEELEAFIERFEETARSMNFGGDAEEDWDMPNREAPPGAFHDGEYSALATI